MTAALSSPSAGFPIRWLPLALALMLGGCPTGAPDSDDDDTTEDVEPFDPPDEPGPYAAATIEDIAPSREGLSLPVQLWFPALHPDDDLHVYDDLIEGAAADGGGPDCSESRPVLVFSHGNSGIRYQTWSVMEFLASHGWFVVAPDHVDNTFLDFDMDLWPRIAMRRPWDVADAFDWLVARSADEDDTLAGCVDPSAGYAVMGHSFGGFTTYATSGAWIDMDLMAATCAADPVEGCDAVDLWQAEHPGERYADHSDPRVWAAVPWAPAWHEAFGGTMTEIAVPTLVIGGDRDTLTPWASAVEPSYRELTVVPRYLAGLEDTGHFSFTDFCDLLPPNGNNGCGEDFRPYDEVLGTTRTLSLAFLLATQGVEDAVAYLPPDVGMWVWEAEE